jgi:photosystem II stability/assembly factor-like uncharacterized protein
MYTIHGQKCGWVRWLVLAMLGGSILLWQTPNSLAQEPTILLQPVLGVSGSQVRPDRPMSEGLASPLGIRVRKQFEETSYYLNDVDFVDAQQGWAVADVHWDQERREYVGTILVTTDGGIAWVEQEAGVAETLRGVDFVDAHVGWAVGAGGTILHTTDGGGHWARQAVATTDEFRGVVFADAENGWATSIAVAHNDSSGEPDDWRGHVWHTANGGTTWTRQDLPADASILNRIDFIDAQHGWAAGIKFVGYDAGRPQHCAMAYYTENGGQTWSERFNLDLEIVLTGVDFVGPQVGYAVGFKMNTGVEGSTLFATRDGGQTWERQTSALLSAVLWDVQFVDAQRGYATGAMYGAAWGPPVLRTMDGGATWQEVRMDRHDGEGCYGLAVVGSQVVLVGDHDFVGRSTRAWDSCEWTFPEPTCYNCDCLFEQQYISAHYRFQDVFFEDEDHGWAVGSRTFEPELWGQVILATEDGGEHWDTQYEMAPPDTLFSYYRLDSVFFVDQRNGWAVGSSERLADGKYHGAILHTTDGGQQWLEQGAELFEGRAREFFDVQFTSPQNGWALAESKFPSSNIWLAKTTDAGAHWSWVDTGIEGDMGVGFALVQGELDFVDAQHGWATGGQGQVIYTEDSGAQWARQQLTCDSPTCNKRLFAIDMLNAQEGWIGGEGLYHTVNGGAQWAMQAYGPAGRTQPDIHDLQFPDTRTAWMAGAYGMLRYSVDGGTTWVPLSNSAYGDLFGLSFLGPQQGWIVGDYGTILAVEQAPVFQVKLPLIVGGGNR